MSDEPNRWIERVNELEQENADLRQKNEQQEGLLEDGMKSMAALAGEIGKLRRQVEAEQGGEVMGILVRCLNCDLLWRYIDEYSNAGGTVPTKAIQRYCPRCGSNACKAAVEKAEADLAAAREQAKALIMPGDWRERVGAALAAYEASQASAGAPVR